MTANDGLEHRIADLYAAEAPTRAPDWVLAEALATIESTHQRRAFDRVPWRFPTMTMSARVAVAAVAVFAVGALGFTLVGGQPAGAPGSTPSPAVSPSPSPSPSISPPPPLTESFTSPVHGMSTAYPAGWTAQQATEPWISGPPAFQAAYGDHLYDPALRDHLFLGLYSEPIEPGRDQDWIGERLGGFDPECALDTEEVTVARAVGQLSSRCLVAAVPVGGRGHLIWLYVSDDDPGIADRYDAAWFREVLATVRLAPADAWTRPELTESYASAIHGSTVSYPAGWTTRPASEPWTSGELTQESAFADLLFQRASDSPSIALASQPLGGQTAEAWIAAFFAARPCGERTPRDVGGLPGVVAECDSGVTAVAVAGDRAHVVWLYGIRDGAWFQQVLDTVRLPAGT
jgi:hypothetical protein